MSYTCINCSVRFTDANIQREHYKTDWHRYNLKRRIVDLPPVTADEFHNRVIEQRNAEVNALQETQTVLFCNACHKNFSSTNAHNNHMKSKKHKENLINFCKENEEKEVTSKVIKCLKEKEKMEDEISEVDSCEWEVVGDPNAVNNCIFCDEHSENLMENLKHMSVVHSFFIPEVEYCVDIEGLLSYLLEKVTQDFICLWCNDHGKTFYSLDAVRKHMKDKGHCKMLHEGIALAEYADFYDYSSSYPDYEEGMDVDEEIQPDILEGDEYQLVLPSGLVIGHRSLMRYYKQRLNPNRSLVPKKSDRKLHKVLSEYRSLGWTTTQQQAAAKTAKDIHFMKRLQAKYSMQLGVKSSRMQRYFRPQVNF